MKTRLKTLSHLVILCSTFVTTAVFGATITWIGPGTNLGHTTNWLGGSPTNGTLCVFNGSIGGNLVLHSFDGINGSIGGNPIGGGFGASGISINLTSTQTGSVTLKSTNVASVAMGFNGIQVDSGAGQLTLGDNTANQLVCQLRPSAGTHVWMNNSTNPVIINPNVQIQNGGGAPGHVINFQGSGDFVITKNLRFFDGPPLNLQWDSTGTTIWAAGGNGMGTGNDQFNSPIGSVTINAGTVIVVSTNLLPRLSPLTTTVNNGSLIVNGNNGASPIIVNGGTLGGTGMVGTVTVQSDGTLAPGTSVGTLTINSNLTIGGNLVIEVNKSLAQSNDLVVVSGGLTNTGTGTLTVANLGPALAIGDKFTLFSQPVTNGAALTVTGSGANWVNDLAVDGSITISSFVPAPTLNFTNTGGGVQFSWTGSFKLQSQTNSLDVGISNNWSDYPGGGTSGVTVPIDATNEAVFFRLAPAP